MSKNLLIHGQTMSAPVKGMLAHMHHVPTSKQDEHTLLWHCLHQCDTLSAQSHYSCR